MTLSQASTQDETRQEPFRWSQADIAQAFAAFDDRFAPPGSQRQYAQEHGIPRSTLGYWLNHDFPDHLHPSFVSFFCSPPGQAFSRRLVVTLLLVFHHRNPCGFRAIGDFLELIQLDSFVGSSYGALRCFDLHLQDELVNFDQQQRAQLIPGMPTRDIPLCLDENFHGPHICLVGIEPVSGFILVETYADHRDSATWAVAITTGLQGLAVNCVLFTSDQASGLVRCALHEFHVAYHPDLFHLQRDLAKPILAPLARPIHQAQKDLEKAQQETDKLDEAERQNGPQTLDVAVEIVREEIKAQQRLEQARAKLEQAAQPIRDIAKVYHPFDRHSGESVTAEQMQTRLSEPLQRLAEVVENEGLSQRAREAVAKAREWVVVLSGCIGWFWTLSNQRIEALDVSDEAQQLLLCLLAGYYWEMASQREKEPDERKRLEELAQRLKQQAWAKGGALQGLSETEKKEAERVMKECAGLFCRSSSCVEGRNGRLSLFHHGQTRLSNKRLKTLTVIHNWVVLRADGTTAAERFFGQKHPDAFSWLLQRLPDLPRPAAKRPRRDSAIRPVAA